MLRSARKWLLAWALGALAMIGCAGDDRLSQAELGELDRLYAQIRTTCERAAPLRGKDKARVYANVSRVIALTREAPDQRWVLDPDDFDTGTTSPEVRLIALQEVLGDRDSARDAEPCSAFQAGRIEQVLADLP